MIQGSVPVKIQFDETSQFAEGSVHVSVTTFLSGLQKLPKTGMPWRYHILTGRNDRSETTCQIINQ